MSEVTYGQLDEALRSLGFSVGVVTAGVAQAKTRLYKHAPTGALVFLPARPLNEPAIPQHLIVVRTTLDNFGIATPRELAASLLNGAGHGKDMDERKG